MKNKSKYALMLASALVVAASAQAAQYANGDLLLGFSGGSQDFVYDLGPVSSLTTGQTWNVGANQGTQFGVVGAFLQGSTGLIYSTSAASDENGLDPHNLYLPASYNVATLAGGTTALTLGGSRATSASDTTGWTYQTVAVQPGNTFQNNFENPNASVSAQAYLFENNNDGTVTADSFFSYNSTSGQLAFGAIAVPEPSTLSLFGGFALLALAWRRQRLSRHSQQSL
jgi:PEP-CTERM motif